MLDCSYSDYQKYSVILPTFGAIIDDTDFSDRVVIKFAVKEIAVDSLMTKVTEMSGGRDKPEITGERFDYK